MEYYRTPTNMTLDADEPEIEEMFHYAIVLWGIYHGYNIFKVVHVFYDNIGYNADSSVAITCKIEEYETLF